jgi:hypothetical protein
MSSIADMPLVVFAGIESLIALVVLALFAALSSMLQKWQRSRQQGPPPGQDRPGGPASARRGASTPASDWEEELRRLLGQGSEQLPPPPPPPVVVPRPVQVPPAPPPIVTQRPLLRKHHEAETHEACPTLETADLVVTPPILGRLEESHAAFAAVDQIDELVAARLERVMKHPVELTHATRRQVASPDVLQALAMFRSPHSARQAFIAGQIFGPPRALEPPRT